MGSSHGPEDRLAGGPQDRPFTAGLRARSVTDTTAPVRRTSVGGADPSEGIHSLVESEGAAMALVSNRPAGKYLHANPRARDPTLCSRFATKNSAVV